MPGSFLADELGHWFKPTEPGAIEQRLDLQEFGRWFSGGGDLVLFAIAAAIAIFLLLQASFNSWRLAVLSFLTLPIALVGGVIAAYIAGGEISLGSLVGFFTVLGIVARNGIMYRVSISSSLGEPRTP